MLAGSGGRWCGGQVVGVVTELAGQGCEIGQEERMGMEVNVSILSIREVRGGEIGPAKGLATDSIRSLDCLPVKAVLLTRSG